MTPHQQSGGLEALKPILLDNFCDGDSWEDARSAMFTRHGALDIASFFYEKGRADRDEEVRGIAEGMMAPRSNDPYSNEYEHGYDRGIYDLLTALSPDVTTKP